MNLIKAFRDYKTIDTTAIKDCLDVPDTFSIDAAQKSFATFLKESKEGHKHVYNASVVDAINALARLSSDWTKRYSTCSPPKNFRQAYNTHLGDIEIPQDSQDCFPDMPAERSMFRWFGLARSRPSSFALCGSGMPA